MLNHTAEPLKSLAVGSAWAQPSVCLGWPLGEKELDGGGGVWVRARGAKESDWKHNRRKKKKKKRSHMCKVLLNMCVISISDFQQVAP